MRKSKLFRWGGAALAVGMLLTQLAAFPANAATPTGKDISECDYVYTFEGGKTVSRPDGIEVSCSALGVPADETVSEVWLDVSLDVSSGLPAMPAMGYTAPGYVNAEGEQTDWYGDGLWMQTPTSQATIVIEIPDDAPLPDKFGVQIWGEDGETIDTMTLNAIGFMTGGGGNIGMMTRKGDVNGDKTVDTADVVALAKYLTGEYGTLTLANAPGLAPDNVQFNAANGDLDKNNVLNANDLTLLKRGILNGEFNQTTNTDETAMEFVSHIKLGWNLGNTLESQNPQYPKNSPYEWETCWGNPATTKAMIDFVKEQGFNCVRVPVSWGGKMDNSSYQIQKEWMDRVQEVVNYVIDDGMYCILNIHHDNDIANYPYFYPDSAHYTQSEKFVTSVWTQVADRFEAYDNHLIFETLNEPRLIGHTNEWWINPGSADCTDAMNNINKLNAAALEVIRKSGGNNEKRFVMMPTYSASPDAANLSGMQMPNDDHLIAEIHAYRPYKFALANDGTQVSTWNQATDAGEIVSFMNDLKSKFTSKGIPVIIDEFGAMNRDNEADRAAWVKYYLETANSYGIPCVWWDNNAFNGNGENFGLINRNSLSVAYPQIMKAMQEATASRG